MQERRAEYTLEDRDSPDLLAVIRDIAAEPRGERRRDRAGALLAAFGRAWEQRRFGFDTVDSASANYVWVLQGRIRAFWLWQAGAIEWLDDESGVPRRPAELLVRAPSTEAIYGADAPDYLHPDLDQPIRRACWARWASPAS